MLTPKEAKRLLKHYSPPRELWPLHCHQVAKIAAIVAAELQKKGCDIQAKNVEAQALVHDIGRSKTHGPMHGWSGFTLLRNLGHEDLGRGCITHWIKGRSPRELENTGKFSKSFIKRIFQALNPQEWLLEDSILSIADSCVMHTTIVSLEERHEDLRVRYGDSTWISQAQNLAETHANQISQALGFSVKDLIQPLHGNQLDNA